MDRISFSPKNLSLFEKLFWWANIEEHSFVAAARNRSVAIKVKSIQRVYNTERSGRERYIICFGEKRHNFLSTRVLPKELGESICREPFRISKYLTLSHISRYFVIWSSTPKFFLIAVMLAHLSRVTQSLLVKSHFFNGFFVSDQCSIACALDASKAAVYSFMFLLLLLMGIVIPLMSNRLFRAFSDLPVVFGKCLWIEASVIPVVTFIVGGYQFFVSLRHVLTSLMLQ